MARPRLFWSAAATAGLAMALGLLLATAGSGQAYRTIIEEWAAVQPPPAPALRPVSLDVKTSALLVLDVQQQNCNRERRPRCVETIPRIQTLLTRAVDKNMLVVYSLARGASVNDVVWQLRPLGSEPVVASVADKFLGTDLERILTEKGIKTVVVMGTAANGAVLYTGSGAALRGLQVVVPVDGMSADTLYYEQYTAWQLLNGPGLAGRVVLTRTDMINF